jgi:hypothetical protein
MVGRKIRPGTSIAFLSVFLGASSLCDAVGALGARKLNHRGAKDTEPESPQPRKGAVHPEVVGGGGVRRLRSPMDCGGRVPAGGGTATPLWIGTDRTFYSPQNGWKRTGIRWSHALLPNRVRSGRSGGSHPKRPAPRSSKSGGGCRRPALRAGTLPPQSKTLRASPLCHQQLRDATPR